MTENPIEALPDRFGLNLPAGPGQDDPAALLDHLVRTLHRDHVTSDRVAGIRYLDGICEGRPLPSVAVDLYPRDDPPSGRRARATTSDHSVTERTAGVRVLEYSAPVDAGDDVVLEVLSRIAADLRAWAVPRGRILALDYMNRAGFDDFDEPYFRVILETDTAPHD